MLLATRNRLCSTRASFYLYTTPAEVDRLADALIYTRDFFGGKL